MERFSSSYKLHSPIAAFILLFFIGLFQNKIIVTIFGGVQYTQPALSS
jgi:hypothetical protein